MGPDEDVLGANEDVDMFDGSYGLPDAPVVGEAVYVDHRGDPAGDVDTPEAEAAEVPDNAGHCSSFQFNENYWIPCKGRLELLWVKSWRRSSPGRNVKTYATRRLMTSYVFYIAR